MCSTGKVLVAKAVFFHSDIERKKELPGDEVRRPASMIVTQKKGVLLVLPGYEDGRNKIKNRFKGVF